MENMEPELNEYTRKERESSHYKRERRALTQENSCA